MKVLIEKNPFEGIADEYDSQKSTNSVLQWMRREVWEITAKYLRPGQRVLELGCGTGIDAIHFANYGLEWLATDSSPSMLNLLESKINELNCGNSIQTQFVDLNDLENTGTCDHEGSFDLVFSNFGALNCWKDLEEISVYMDGMLKRGGLVIANVMTRGCFWEMFYYLMRLQPGIAFRRFSRNGLPVRIGDRYVHTRYFGPREFIRSFKPEFQVEEIIGLCIFVPPPYLAHRVDREPGLFSMTRKLERTVRPLPLFRAIGDHVIIVMRKSG